MIPAPKPSRTPRILIVGGGIAGLSMATRLGRTLRHENAADIVLIDKSPSHVWKPMLHTFAAGTWNAHQHKVSFIAQGKLAGFRYMPGALDTIDRVARTVTLLPLLSPSGELVLGERSLDYDFLIFAVGSQANDFGTPGVAENCLFIDDLRQAEAFNQKFYAQLLKTATHGDPLEVAIVGGGATGVELSAEISQLIDIVATYGAGNLRPKLRLTLIESGSRLLGPFSETVSSAATKTLESLGVEVRLDTTVIGADETGFILGDGSRIDATLRVWAAGVKAPAAIARIEGLDHSRSGQLVVNSGLQTNKDGRIFALGDCSSLTLPGASTSLPATAQVARQQALHLSRQLPGWLRGNTMAPFAFRDYGSLVSLSRYTAYGTLGRTKALRNNFIQGTAARLGHSMLYRLHQAELHGFPRALALWLSDLIGSFARPKIRTD